MPILRLDPGKRYTRADVFQEIPLDPHPRGGPWFTGYVTHRGMHFIFCNVGASGRTGHDYPNEWINGTLLRWYGKGGAARTSPQIAKMISNHSQVHLFHRRNDRDPFTYAGLVRALSANDERPVEVLWEVIPADGIFVPPDEIADTGQYVEGAVRRVMVNAYERSEVARQDCILYYGAKCVVCDARFDELYGELGTGFIHVHHLVPLGTVQSTYVVDPVRDLRPVCANCHAMLHRRDPPLDPAELKTYVTARRKLGATASNLRNSVQNVPPSRSI